MPSIAGRLQKVATGTTNSHVRVRPQETLRWTVPFPPMEEQRRIAETLDTIGDTIRATERIITKLAHIRVGTARHLFGVVAGRRTKLRDIARISSGSTPDRGRDDYWGGSIPWVRTGEVRGRLITATEESITQRALAECPLQVYPVDTILVAMYGQGQTRGRVAMLGLPAATNQACAAIEPAPREVDGRYLFEFIKSSYEEIRALAHGSHQENLSTKLLGDFRVLIPNAAEQQRVYATLVSIDRRIDAELADLAKLVDLRAGLAADLLSGRMPVPV